MGTYYSVKVVSASRDGELARDIKLSLDKLNKIFSTYDPNSELSKLNTASNHVKIPISEELKYILELSKSIHTETAGYFDVTVGPIVNAWGFGPDKNKKRPSEDELKLLKKNVGMELFSVDDNLFQKSKKDLYIDLSAVAKGYAVDMVMKFLKERGIKSGLVEIGGEVKATGVKPNGKEWLIGIEKPNETLGEGIQAIVTLKDMAMATSGSYRNYVKYGDEVFGHTIDPTSGVPANTNVISVTVLHSECANADAYATAMLAMGIRKAKNLAKKLKLAAYFIVKNGERVDIVSTEAFKPFMKEI